MDTRMQTTNKMTVQTATAIRSHQVRPSHFVRIASSRMRFPPRLRPANFGGSDQSEAGSPACFRKTGIAQKMELADSSLQPAVPGRAIASDQTGVPIARMAGQFHDLSGNLREPADEKIRVRDPMGIGNAGQPFVAGKSYCCLMLGLQPS